MITNLFGVLAQFEREQIGERTVFALSHKRKERLIYGHPPFGWSRENDRLIPVEAEQRDLPAIRKLDADGMSYRHIGGWLEGNAFKPRQGGKQWHAAFCSQDVTFQSVYGTRLKPVGRNTHYSNLFFSSSWL